MRPLLLTDPRSRPSHRAHRTLMLALGLSILTALAVTGASPSPQDQGFSQPAQSPSFMPETVRLKAPE